MTVAVLSIGTELTRGELVNTNAAWLADALTELGFEVTEESMVDDHAPRIQAALRRLSVTHGVIVCTGGLGPTTDDLTTAAVASMMGKRLVRDEASIEHMKRRFEKLGRPLLASNEKQADFPEGAEILANPIGTAPGFRVVIGEAQVFFMPGVPREIKKMFEEQITPKLRPLAPNDTVQTRLRTFGMPESAVGEKLAGIEDAFPGVIIGYRAHFPEIEVKVLAKGARFDDAHALCEAATKEVRARLGDIVYGDGNDTFAGVVGRVLRTRGLTLALAESCTGGLVGHLITREPGASDFLLLDAVTYANSAKTQVLGVDEDVLRAHGAVSAEVAIAMAEGARRVSGASVALSLTGIAGPTGGSDAKPVGTVHMAVAGERGTEHVHRVFPYDREMIQTVAAYTGLLALRRYVSR